MRQLLTFTLVFFTVLSYSQPKNILIGTMRKPNEPSIMFNFQNPKHMVAAANIWNYYVSSDSGYTWEEKTQSSTYGVWGDPVLVNDTAGHFYYFHLSNPPKGNWIDRIVCQKSEDNGQTWTLGTFMGLDGKKAQDKHWAVVDRTNNNIYVTWTQFDKYGSDKKKDISLIMFSKSTDGGETWAKSKRINEVVGDCVDDDLTVEGAVPAVGPNGEIYVSWAGPAGIIFDKSTDGGETWLAKDVFVDSLPGGWSIDIPGLNRCNGMPVTKCDLSTSPNNGTIYINWSDQSNGLDNTDIWLKKSTDGGETWSDKVRVNNDTTSTHQFLTWMDIDQSTGYLYFIWYDRRAYSDDQTDVYAAVSKDGGETFINHKISEKVFTPTKSTFFGDYNNIVANNGLVRPVWTRMDDGKTSVYTAALSEWLKEINE
ncbi:MAG: hypothetical protein ACJAZ3_001577 [Sphingobacteriales bacterium]|jgi:hypothetical protein